MSPVEQLTRKTSWRGRALPGTAPYRPESATRFASNGSQKILGAKRRIF